MFVDRLPLLTDSDGLMCATEVNTMAVVLAEVNGDSDFVTTSPVAVHPLNARRTTPDLPLRKRATKANRSPSLPVPLPLFPRENPKPESGNLPATSQEPFCDTSKTAHENGRRRQTPIHRPPARPAAALRSPVDLSVPVEITRDNLGGASTEEARNYSISCQITRPLSHTDTVRSPHAPLPSPAGGRAAEDANEFGPVRSVGSTPCRRTEYACLILQCNPSPAADQASS